MNRDLVAKLLRAVLYEGHMLYPYRPSALKNRRRWNFGVLFPEGHRSVRTEAESSFMRTEGLAAVTPDAVVRARIVFLQIVEPGATPGPDVPVGLSDAGTASPPQAGELWQETVEREVVAGPADPVDLCRRPAGVSFRLPRRSQAEVPGGPCGNPAALRGVQEMIEGAVELRAEQVDSRVFRLSVQITNRTPVGDFNRGSRDRALMDCMISTHTILEISGGEFMSMIDPPGPYAEAARACRNIGTWPVLAGAEGERDCLLSSPIILYDYPQIAPESDGDFFDATEIDELLALRVLTLTDDEKKAARQGDASAREILDRTESLPAEQLLKLHGVLRGLRDGKRGE